MAASHGKTPLKSGLLVPIQAGHGSGAPYAPGVVLVAVNPKVWLVLGLLFQAALARRLWLAWWAGHRARRAAAGSRAGPLAAPTRVASGPQTRPGPRGVG